MLQTSYLQLPTSYQKEGIGKRFRLKKRLINTLLGFFFRSDSTNFNSNIRFITLFSETKVFIEEVL